MTEQMHELLLKNRFLSSMRLADIHLLCQFCRIRSFERGEYVAREGQVSMHFYLLLEGVLTVESYKPHTKAMTIQTLYAGDMFGLHGFFPPFLWNFDMRALTPIKTVAFDSGLIREQCEQHQTFGYELLQRIGHNLAIRLTDVRLQILDASVNHGVNNEYEECYDSELRI